jgi:hypothetical protein
MSERQHQVICRRCQRTFEGYGPTSAHGCAASFSRGVVYGHYGSKHDACAIRVPFADAAAEVMDPVCDDCVDAWMARGGVEIQEWMDFDQPGPVRAWERSPRDLKN